MVTVGQSKAANGANPTIQTPFQNPAKDNQAEDAARSSGATHDGLDVGSQPADSQFPMPSTFPSSTIPPQGGGVQTSVDDDSALPPLTIPLGHRCSNDSLLMLPQIQALIGQYPEDFFFRVESRRRLPRTQTFNPIEDNLEVPQVDAETSSLLINRFFQSVYLVNPFLDEAAYVQRYTSNVNSNVETLPNERAVKLLVFALGTIGGKSIKRDDDSEENVPGMQFFEPAVHILTISWTSCFCGDVTLAQGLVLCALYLCYISQPLRAWKIIHMASTTVQQLLIRYVVLRFITGIITWHCLIISFW